MTEQQRQDVALFRYGVIGPLVSGELCHGELKGKIRELSMRCYTIPFSSRSSIGFGTIEEWLSNFRHKGFDGLKPKPRNDRGTLRGVRAQLKEDLLRMRMDNPKMSVDLICRELIRSNKMKSGELSATNIYRLFALHLPRRMATRTGKEQKRFVHQYPNQCWQGDVMHGPYIKDAVCKRSRKTYLVAFIDDASRVITGAEFFHSEATVNVKAVLRDALRKYGIPRKLYLDNGRNFKSQDISIACASLQIALIHSTPYYPQGKGKIERFFRTVRSRFLPCLKHVTSLNELNMCFDLWLQNEYNRHAHSALNNQQPLQVYLNKIEGRMRTMPKHVAVEELFCHKIMRLVAKDATFRVNNILYEAEEQLIGRKITVLYDKDCPKKIVKVFDGPVYVHQAEPIDYISNSKASRKELE